MIPAFAFIIARILIAGLLFWAVAHPVYHRYLVFQLAVFAVAAWGGYRAFREEEFALLIALFLIFLAFNPINPFRFEKTTWAMIDTGTGVLLLASLFLLSTGPLDPWLENPGGKKAQLFAAVVWGIIGMLFGAVLIYDSAHRITAIVKIKLNGKDTQASITRVVHQVHTTTDADHNTEYYDVYKTDYTFNTEDGGLMNGSAELSDNPVSHLSADEFAAQYSHGYLVDPNNPVLLRVEYEAGNPGNNRAVNHRIGFFGTIFSGLFISLLSLCPIVWGFYQSKENGLKLLPEPKPDPAKNKAAKAKK